MPAPTLAPATETVAVGQPVPDFTLKTTSGTPVTLSSLRGQNVLLAFFPLAFTSTCTAELCDMRDDYDLFAQYNVAILPISVDAVPSLREFKRQHEMKTELLSDFKRDVSRSYGVLMEDAFMSTRAYFLIDAEGILRWMHVEENPGQKRSTEELLAQVLALAA
ncbi:MAG: redoxin domain-containing protein [Gemmatimonadaceae bacterium]|nr:redoxin domain-containing protein [Gemmatimonadaceae bacterium]